MDVLESGISMVEAFKDIRNYRQERLNIVNTAHTKEIESWKLEVGEVEHQLQGESLNPRVRSTGLSEPAFQHRYPGRK